MGVSHLWSDLCHPYYFDWGMGKFDALGSYPYLLTLNAAGKFGVCSQMANDQKTKNWKWRESDLEVWGMVVGKVVGLCCYLWLHWLEGLSLSLLGGG